MSGDGATIRSLYSSSSVTNPTPKIWEGKNDKGVFADNGVYTVLISATSISTGVSMTDSSKTITIASPSSGTDSSQDTSDDSSAATSTDETKTANTTTSISSSGPPEFLPIPTLRIITSGNRTISSGADAAFSAVVYDNKSNKRDDALVKWSFGDGMQKTGASVFHSYYEPGTYLAVVRASTPDGGEASNEITITVKNAGIKIASISSRGITIANNDSRNLDLSFWRLSMGGQEFKIPEDTEILAGQTILFPSQVIELPIADSASLLYPSGEVAAAYPETTILAQPSSSNSSLNIVQTVEPIISQRTNLQSDENAVNAPAATTELAAAGAALDSAAPNHASSLIKSPWTLGSIGVVVLAGAAFILL